MRTFWIAVALLVGGCADEFAGIDPPGDDVYFPIGITTVTDASGADAFVVVSSSNFDQRFNAGTLAAMPVGPLFALVGDGSTINFVDDISSGIVDFEKIFSFGGDLLYVPTGDTGRLFVASRGRNRLTMVRVDTTNAEDPLDCSGPGDPLSTTSCSPAHIEQTGFTDPFSLAHSPAAGTQPDLVAVGHIARIQENNTIFSAVSVASVAAFDARVAAEAAGDGISSSLTTTRIPSFGGISGMGYSAGGRFFATGFTTAPDLLLSGFEVSLADEMRQIYALRQSGAVRLSSELQAIETRSFAVHTSTTGSRGYASVRFVASGDSTNAGIAVVDLDLDPPEVVSLLEVGEELQRPFVRETNGSRLLYVGDIRRDRVYVIDVTTDRPILVHEIGGRAERTIDGETVQVSLLDGPTQMTFASSGGRDLGFITNFANSTIAVIDVTDPDPRTHDVIARLGQNIDADGEMEGP